MVLDDPGANRGSAREAWKRPTVRIDWLQGAILPEEVGTQTRADLAWLMTEPKRIGQPRGVKGYHLWQGDTHGTMVGLRLERDEKDQPQPTRAFLILKGSGLVQMRAEDRSDRDALHRFAEWKGSMTRLDLAIDVQHPEVTPMAFRQMHERGQLVTRLQRPGWWGTPETGCTWYLGSGDVLVRVYDKSAERARRGAPIGEGITRIEMELRRRSAKTAARKLAAIPEERWATEFPRNVIAWFLDKIEPKARPVTKNPQRVPRWEAFEEAIDGIGPVPLGRDEADRTAEREYAAKMEFASHARKACAVLLGDIGTAAFLQWAREGMTDELRAFRKTVTDEAALKVLETLGFPVGDGAATGDDGGLWPR
ncbi:MAG: replication initiation factor domain-containing protein [Longimicrobiales bacterium]